MLPVEHLRIGRRCEGEPAHELLPGDVPQQDLIGLRIQDGQVRAVGRKQGERHIVFGMPTHVEGRLEFLGGDVPGLHVAVRLDIVQVLPGAVDREAAHQV